MLLIEHCLQLLGYRLSGRSTVGKDHRALLTDASGRNRHVAFLKACQHGYFFASRRQPQNAPGAIDCGIGQRHSPPRLVNPGHSYVFISNAEHRISWHQRSSVTVRPKAEMNEIESWW